jgi:rubrerythrin
MAESSDNDWTIFYRDTQKATDAEARKPMRPKGQVENGNHHHLDQTVSALRIVTTSLGEKAEAYVNHSRSLRYFEAVPAGQNAQKSITCNKCKATGLRGQDFTLLTKCGHVICNRKCNVKREDDSCPVCKVWNNAHQNILGSTLCKPRPPVIWIYGQKLGEIVQLIKSIPEGDKVLLFVQFPKVLEELNGALKREDNRYSDLNSGYSSEKLSAF